MNAHRSKRSAPARRGSTLVELMIAAVILTVGASASAVQAARAHALRRTSEETLTACSYLRSVMVEVRRQDPADLLLAGHAFAPGALTPTASLPFTLDEQSTTIEYPGYTTGDDAPRLLPVRVTTRWNSSGGQVRTLEMNTVVKR